MEKDLDIPEFLRIPQDRRKKAWEEWTVTHPAIKVVEERRTITPPKVETVHPGPSHDPVKVTEIEGLLDDEGVDYYEWLTSHDVGAFTLRFVIEKYQNRIANSDESKETKNKCQAIIEAANQILNNKRRSRKPRKMKRASVGKLVEKIRYLEIEPATRHASLTPEAILNKTVLWAYDAEKRFLKLYRAQEGKGFTFDRTSITNVDEEQSFQKKIRKPEKILPLVVNEDKATILGLFKNIKAVEQPINTFRTNDNLVFLRVF